MAAVPPPRILRRAVSRADVQLHGALSSGNTGRQSPQEVEMPRLTVGPIQLRYDLQGDGALLLVAKSNRGLAYLFQARHGFGTFGRVVVSAIPVTSDLLIHEGHHGAPSATKPLHSCCSPAERQCSLGLMRCASHSPPVRGGSFATTCATAARRQRRTRKGPRTHFGTSPPPPRLLSMRSAAGLRTSPASGRWDGRPSGGSRPSESVLSSHLACTRPVCPSLATAPCFPAAPG
jgi:hypothetical protein